MHKLCTHKNKQLIYLHIVTNLYIQLELNQLLFCLSHKEL